ncbi:MAG: BMP family ABC transporter substrate-binding protein, partial [Clostridium sp.]|nr:BMP family ABC transporter substrate-binding protein [Clostridium sp.]
MKKCGKKLIGLLMAVAMVSTMALSGCKEKAPETMAAGTEAQTEAGQTAAEAAGAENGGESQAAENGKDPNRLIKIGFLFSNVISTDAWAQTSENARLYLEENCENVETTKVENIAGGADCERVLREFINDGCEIIVGTSFDYLDYMLALADEYPDIVFINGSGYETKDNLSVYIAKLEQGRYLTGMMAGEMTEANKIGYCSSIPFPDPIKQLNGFAAGVASVNPDAKVVTLWSNSFNDPT